MEKNDQESKNVLDYLICICECYRKLPDDEIGEIKNKLKIITTDHELKMPLLLVNIIKLDGLSYGKLKDPLTFWIFLTIES
jgi:hypothetical protein